MNDGRGAAIMGRPHGVYPMNWREIATRVKQEAGWRCVRCKHPDPPDCVPRGHHRCDEHCVHERDTTKRRKQRVLTVHHLDGNKSNVRWWNLLALCQVCHLVIQAKVIPQRPYLWDHARWFLPYVCGFYAWYYGEQEITRAMAEQEPTRWLRLGQPWLFES